MKRASVTFRNQPVLQQKVMLEKPCAEKNQKKIVYTLSLRESLGFHCLTSSTQLKYTTQQEVVCLTKLTLNRKRG